MFPKMRNKNKMDKLPVFAEILFMAAAVSTIVSLEMPDSITIDVAGDTHLGLMWSWMTLYSRPQVDCTPDVQQSQWLLPLLCIFIGCLCIINTVNLLASSRFGRNAITNARWVGYGAMTAFYLAAVIFPMVSYVNEIGGQAYQLPNSHKVGISYDIILFVLFLWMTVTSEVFAGKVGLSHF